MPVLVSFFARQLVIIGVQLGIFALIDKYITPLLNGAIGAIVKAFGVDEKAATDILANEILTTAESLGLTVALSKARLPLALADKLGFTTKGFSKRAVSPDVEAKVAKARAGGGFGTVAPIVPTATEATGIIAKATASLSGFGKAYAAVLGTLSTIFIGFIAINNLIDFGNWNSGAYQKTFQKIFAFVSGGLLVPDEDYRKTKTVSPEVFDKVYNTYKLNGAVAISDPFKKASVAFTRDNLIDLLDQVGATLLLTTQKAATKDVLLASQLMISFSIPKETPPATVAPATVVKIPQVKVFTGIVSQGTLGSGLVFTSRPNDLIESAEELQDAATNNLAATLAALPSSLVYEIKIVSAVVSKDGFRQSGTIQRIVSGYNKDGSPKYRTVVNKFATLTVYFINEKGSRTKIRQITLGPTDVVRFNPTAGQIVAVETSIKDNMTTSNINDIQIITGNAPLATSALPPSAVAPSAPVVPSAVSSEKSASGLSYDPFWATFSITLAGWNALSPASRDRVVPIDGQTGKIARAPSSVVATPPPAPSAPAPVAPAPSVQTGLRPDQQALYNQLVGAGASPASALNAVNLIPKPATATNPAVCSATTLWELSQALGEALPTVAKRAPEYERLGLGQAAYYTGTAEQNTKLLKALQRQHGCGT